MILGNVGTNVFLISNYIVIVLHLVVIAGLVNFVFLFLKKFSKKKYNVNLPAIITFAITFVYLAGGWYVAHHVVESNYSLTSGKVSGQLKIAMFADSHLGTTFDGNGFAKELSKIQKSNPDVLFMAGDFVDDDTTKEDMIVACDALGKFEAKYGIFFVYGNHDRGYFRYRNFTEDELETELQKNGVVILEDEIVQLTDEVVIVGRQDKSVHSRKNISELMQDIDSNKYVIVLDHQPGDYDAEAAAKVDMVLSGHTHGGWLFPMGIINKYIGPDDRIYGEEYRDKSYFLVTSGISDWALQFKTGTKAEYTIIDINEE